MDKAHNITTGIPLGYSYDQKRSRDQWQKLTYGGDQHLTLIAPTRTGKGTTMSIPTLLEYDASCFVVDPKGELAAVTARHRRDRLGHEVFILNPFGVMQQEFAERGFPKSHCFNPLALLTPASSSFLADGARLGESFIYHDAKDRYWSDAAQELVTALLMYVCIEGRACTFHRVRKLLTAAREDVLQTFAEMAAANFPPLKQRAQQFLDSIEEMQKVLALARTQTSFLDDPVIAASLSRSDFQFIDLKRKKVTVYLVLGAKDIIPYAKWLRLLLTAALNELMATEEKGPQPVLFLLDEFTKFGQLSILETAMALAVDYGIQMFPIVQDVNQLKNVYQDRWETFLANAGVVQYFTPNDMTTAEYLSKRCGMRTVEVLSKAERKMYAHDEAFPDGLPDPGLQQHRIYAPEELYGLPTHDQLIFYARRQNPIRGARFPYYECDDATNGITSYKGLYDPNPYYRQQSHAANSSLHWPDETLQERRVRKLRKFL